MNRFQSGLADTQKNWPIYLFRAFAAALAIFAMEAFGHFFAVPLPQMPFVTSILLTVSLPQSPAARPYAVIVGHAVSAILGLVVLWTFGPGEGQNALAIGLATFAMLSLRALHPPAGFDAFVVTSYGVGASWLLVPVLLGAVLLAAYGRAAFWLEQRLFGAMTEF